jgi:hypothetical protein
MSSSGVTSLNQLPSLNNQNGHIQQQMMMQQPQNVVLNRSEIVSTNNNQMTTSNYNQLIPTSGTYSSNPITQNNNLTMENQNQNQNQNPNYNELITQLQKASAYGTTALPSRDIPMDPINVANDIQSQPNYIPPPPQFQEDYIKNTISPENLIETNRLENIYETTFERLYRESQLPLIIALLYFLFQLPAVKQYNKKLLPFLFKSDGNPNVYGYISNSIMFASMVYILLKLISYLV